MTAKVKRKVNQPPPSGRRAAHTQPTPTKAAIARIACQTNIHRNPLVHALDIIYRVYCLASDPGPVEEIRCEL